jgi:hypothetical protein
MYADVFSDSVKQPAGANVIEVLVIVNAERSLVPSIVLMVFGRVNNTTKKSSPAHELVNQVIASIKGQIG